MSYLDIESFFESIDDELAEGSNEGGKNRNDC
jgi:hypothetical protein